MQIEGAVALDQRARKILNEIESLGFIIIAKAKANSIELRAICRVTSEEFVAKCDQHQAGKGACELWALIDLNRLIGPPPGDAEADD
jgi:hypothetical protein